MPSNNRFSMRPSVPVIKGFSYDVEGLQYAPIMVREANRVPGLQHLGHDVVIAAFLASYCEDQFMLVTIPMLISDEIVEVDPDLEIEDFPLFCDSKLSIASTPELEQHRKVFLLSGSQDLLAEIMPNEAFGRVFLKHIRELAQGSLARDGLVCRAEWKRALSQAQLWPIAIDKKASLSTHESSLSF